MRPDVPDGALKALNEGDVFPEVAGQMEQAICRRQQRKEYDSITGGRQLAQVLTDHLREVSHDKYLAVNYTRQVLPPQPPPPAPDARPSADQQTQLERQITIAGRQNFRFVRIERLAGNIGYIDFRAFMAPAIAGDTAAAAMTFLASCDAVIFDMRQNGGGDPAMVSFITSYLFGPQPVHLNDFYFRPTNETRPSWTLPYVPGKRLTTKDVYILTSSRTFSGAEEFTYNLKHLKRATVVGETTGGGAEDRSERRRHTELDAHEDSSHGHPVCRILGHLDDWSYPGPNPAALLTISNWPTTGASGWDLRPSRLRCFITVCLSQQGTLIG